MLLDGVLSRKNSRRSLLVSIVSLVGGGTFLGSPALRILERRNPLNSKKGILVRVSFHSKLHPDKKYATIDEFWMDHPSVFKTPRTADSPLKDFVGQRLSALIVFGKPVYEVYYPSLSDYQKHLDYLSEIQAFQRESLTGNYIKYISDDFFAIDEIKKIS